MDWRHGFGAVAACFVAIPATAQLSFIDVTATAGVGQPGMLTESAAWGDYDGDGDEDLYLTNNGANALFRNDGSDVFTDVTATAGVEGGTLFSVGACFGDLDNDGDLDLYVVTFGGTDRDLLFRNDGPIGVGGETVFVEIAETSGIDTITSSRPCALLDYDQDGLLDIFVMSLLTGTMVFIALALAPILPGWEVSTRTIRTDKGMMTRS